MNELRNLRVKNKYTCKDMADKLNISKPFYWQLENNKRRLSYEMAIRIASVFDTTPDKIFYKEFKIKVESQIEEY